MSTPSIGMTAPNCSSVPTRNACWAASLAATTQLPICGRVRTRRWGCRSSTARMAQRAEGQHELHAQRHPGPGRLHNLRLRGVCVLRFPDDIHASVRGNHQLTLAPADSRLRKGSQTTRTTAPLISATRRLTWTTCKLQQLHLAGIWAA